MAEATVHGTGNAALEQDLSVDVLLGEFVRRLDSRRVVAEVTEALITWDPEGRPN